MDDRGRELQQVGTGSRFWWRALDAQSPGPVASSTPQGPDAFDLSKWTYQGVRGPQQPNLLQIHKSQMRPRRKQAPHARNAGLFASILVLMASAAGVVIAAPHVEFHQPFAELSKKCADALIAAGFGIQQVNVYGQRYVNEAEVFDALDLQNVPTFWALNADETLKRIKRISWVDTAQITRAFPGTLNIEIKERTPAALWQRGDKTYLVDVTGRVLGPVSGSHGWVLPQVSGEGANLEVVNLLTAVSRHPEIEDRFDHGERIADRRWSVRLKTGSQIELAADREVEGLDQVVNSRFLLNSVSGRTPVIVDVRTAGRIAVRPLSRDVVAHVATGGAAQP